MFPSSSLCLLGVAFAVLSHAPGAEGHAYLCGPFSRIVYYTPAFQPPGFPDMEYCPHCYQSRGPANVRARAEANTDPVELALYGDGQWPHFSAYQRGELASNGNYYETDAIAVRHGICGDPEQTAAEGTNKYGKENSIYPVLETFPEGGIIEMKVVVSTYHWGHLEFFICNAEDLPDGPDSVVTQGCFNMHPLDRAADDGDASPIDPNHKGRYYLDPPCVAAERDQEITPCPFPGDVVIARYQLPEGLTCERCIVQMVYYTGNSCRHPGYDEFDPPSWPSECAPNKSDWITLDPAVCGDGDAYPEEFWNCADISIVRDGESSSASSSTEPEPTPEPTPAPESSSSDASTMPRHTYQPATGSTVGYTFEPTPAPSSSEPRESSDDETVGESAYEPSPAPTVDYHAEPTAKPRYPSYPSPSPSREPRGSRNNQPTTSKTSTLAPATFAPSVSHAPMPKCRDPVAAFGQCGGADYEGETCCRQGYECVEVADCYSECRPIPDRCSEGWGQCGGRQWDGPTCCWEGAECIERNEWYSQCIPKTS